MTTGLFPDFEPRLLHHEAMDLLPRGSAVNFFIEQNFGRFQFRQDDRGIERGIQPSMGVAKIGIISDAPAQIKNAAGLDDFEQATDRRPDLRAVQMHDHGFAQHIVKTARGNAAQIGQFGRREFQARISLARFREQAFRGVETCSGETVGVEPADLAATATADIGRRPASDKKPLNELLQIDGRRLFVPLLCERCRFAIVGGKRLSIHHQPSIFEKSATARVAARISFSNLSRFSRTAGSSSLTLTLSKNASTAGRSFAIALIAAAKSSLATALPASDLTRSMAFASAFSSSSPYSAASGAPSKVRLSFFSSIARMLLARFVPASRFLPSSLSRNLPSASTRRTTISRSSRPPSANTASTRSCRAPWSRSWTFRRSAKKERRSAGSFCASAAGYLA